MLISLIKILFIVIMLENFIDTYLYVVKFMDPKVIDYLKETEQAVNFYYSIEH